MRIDENTTVLKFHNNPLRGSDRSHDTTFTTMHVHKFNPEVTIHLFIIHREYVCMFVIFCFCFVFMFVCYATPPRRFVYQASYFQWFVYDLRSGRGVSV